MLTLSTIVFYSAFCECVCAAASAVFAWDAARRYIGNLLLELTFNRSQINLDSWLLCSHLLHLFSLPFLSSRTCFRCCSLAVLMQWWCFSLSVFLSLSLSLSVSFSLSLRPRNLFYGTLLCVHPVVEFWSFILANRIHLGREDTEWNGIASLYTNSYTHHKERIPRR